MVLTYDAYDETLESEKKKQDRLAEVEAQLNNTQQMLQHLITSLEDTANQQQINIMAKSMFSRGILKSIDI